jgi:hypothetical protein
MASLFKRKGSKHWQLRYKNLTTGKWMSLDTGYNLDGEGTMQAKILLRRAKAKEHIHNAEQQLNKPTAANHPWEEWALSHIETRWGGRHTATIENYRNHYWKLLAYFEEKGIKHPAALTVQHVEDYLLWRLAKGVTKNTAINEISFLGRLLDYPCRTKQWIAVNPARGLRLEKTEYKHAKPWSDFQVETIREVLDEPQYKFGYLYVSFHMGLNQGTRLFQSQTPLDAIDLKQRQIIYPGQITLKNGRMANLVKGGKGYTQVIFRPFIVILEELIPHRLALGEDKLCDLPGTELHPERSHLATKGWRDLLDEFGFADISHHGLRARWARQAIKNGMFPAKSMLYLNHKSPEIHRQYQQLVPQDITSDLDDLADKLGL